MSTFTRLPTRTQILTSLWICRYFSIAKPDLTMAWSNQNITNTNNLITIRPPDHRLLLTWPSPPDLAVSWQFLGQLQLYDSRNLTWDAVSDCLGNICNTWDVLRICTSICGSVRRWIGSPGQVANHVTGTATPPFCANIIWNIQCHRICSQCIWPAKF